MKHKISVKLFAYFSVALLISTAVTGMFFWVLITRFITSQDSMSLVVLLLHAPSVALQELFEQSVQIFVLSIAIALVIALFAGIILSLSFTRPLRQLSQAAKRLAEGDYEIKTGVNEKNELGELAESMDYLAVQLHNAADESVRLEKMRRDFIASVSHELRTPVTIIRGSLESLIDGVVTEKSEVAEYQEQMLKETLHLQRLVNDLLELSRLQTVDFKIEQNPFDIREAALSAARAIQKAAVEKSVVINVEERGEKTPVGSAAQNSENAKIIVGDGDRVRQMFMIILDNAAKFSPAGGEITLRIGGNAISVEDAGTGICAEELPYIFERFKKESSSRNKDGSGLGLAIAKAIASRHGFKLSAQSPIFESAEFPGTRFVCEF